MEEIKRYDPWPDAYGSCRMDQYDDGDFVRYDDHIAIVEKLKAEIEDLKLDLFDANQTLNWIWCRDA